MMDPVAAELVFFAIMGVGTCVWAWSLNRATNLGKPPSEKSDPWANPYADFPAEGSGDNLSSKGQHDVIGQKTVRGQPEKISKLLAKSLLTTNIPGQFSGLFEVTERTAERVLVTKTGPLVCNQSTGMYFSEAEFTLQPESNETVLVTYRLGFDRLVASLRRTALAIILCLGLPVILLVGGLIWFLVVESANPSVRWQVFQCLQIVHVLWPPFLVMHFYGSGQKHARTFISNVLATLDLEVD